MMQFAIFGVVALLSSDPGMAAERSPTCSAKRADIERQIATAKSNGRTREMRGLQKALNANRAHCTAASLQAQRERDISDASRKVAERHAELQDAQADGDIQKIGERRRKLAESRTRLDDVSRR